MTIKKTARAVIVAVILVAAGLVVFGIRVFPEIGSAYGLLLPELAAVLWIAVIVASVQRRLRTTEQAAPLPVLICGMALSVLALVGLAFGAWAFGQDAIAIQDGTELREMLFENSGSAYVPGAFTDKVIEAMIWQQNTQRLLWVIFHACLCMTVPSALSGIALLGMGEKTRATGYRFLTVAAGCAVAGVLLAPMLVGERMDVMQLLAQRKYMGLLLAPMLTGEAVFFRAVNRDA